MTRLLLVLSMPLLLCHCATLRPKPQYTAFGEADPAGDQQVIDRYKALMDSNDESAGQSVKVLVDTVPEGIELKEGLIKVADGYNHEIVGKFALVPQVGTPMWFSEYESTPRKAICWPQVPLVWVTLTLWLVVPTSWVCYGSSVTSKPEFISYVKRLGAAAGGNMVILSMVANQDEVASGTGFILKLDPAMLDPKRRPPDAPPAQSI